jgi:hypothetical protein
VATETAWNQLATDLGSITPPHTIANITGLKNRQVFLPHPVLIAFPQQKWLHEGASLLRYTYIVWLDTAKQC